MRRNLLANKNIAVYVYLILISLLLFSPLLWTIFTSLKPTKEIYHTPITIFPHKVVLDQYRKTLWQMPDVAIYFKNSVVITVASTLLVTILSSLGGYAFGRMRFKGRGFFLSFIMLTITIPYAIYLIPVYIMENKVGLINTNLGLILPYVALNLPLAIFIMRGTFHEIPSELEDASIVDGCSPLQTWYKVMLPLSKGGVAAVMVLTYIAIWEEFTFAVTLMPDAAYQTLPVGIKFLKDEAQSWAYGTLSVVIVLYILPVAIIFLLLQKYLIKGMIEGALKG